VKENNLYYGFPSKIEIINLNGKHVIKDGEHCIINCIIKETEDK